MFRNYFKIALRNILRQRIYSIINVIGLATGLSIFILIMLFINDQRQYDKFNKNYNHIYRLDYSDWSLLGTAYEDDILREFPQVQKGTRIAFNNPVIKYNDKRIRVNDFLFADSSVFDIFSFPFILGNPKTALTDPFTIVITESTARLFFGNENPMGKMLRYNNQYNFRVTGVMKDINHFHLSVNALASFTSLPILSNNKDFLKARGNWNYPTYFLIPGKFDIKAFDRKINSYYKTQDEWKNDEPQFHLCPLKDIYFDYETKNEIGIRHGCIQKIRIFTIIAIFILLIACVNFINLSTARAPMRAKEVGIRKMAGSSKGKLILQFLIESVIISTVAFIISLGITEGLLSFFNDLLSVDLHSNLLLQPGMFLMLFGGSILVGIIAGLYPAFYLTAFQPVEVLKGQKTKGSSAAFLRKLLIVFQFAISIVLIICTIIVDRQLDYVKNKNLGFQKEHIVYFGLNQSIFSRIDVFKASLLQYPDIKKFSTSNTIPGQVTWVEGREVDKKDQHFNLLPVDPDFIDLMKIPVIQGRNFSWQNPSDTNFNIILNEEAVKYFGIQNPVGKHLDNWKPSGIIIGVVKDFNYQSLQDNIGPLVLCWRPKWNFIACIRLSGNNIPETINHIKKEWDKLSPEFPFEYYFLDQSFDKLYKSEQQFGKMFQYFSIISILIACLGLFGLASFTVLQRTKEIGIRKVHGATEATIVNLLTRDFTKLVLIATVIAWPVAWFSMDKWLQGFAFRIQIPMWAFIAAFLIAWFIALFTVSYHALKVANTNPAEALKYE